MYVVEHSSGNSIIPSVFNFFLSVSAQGRCGGPNSQECTIFDILLGIGNGAFDFP